ncbi:RNF149 [Symbiodinium microadriaticum]|nr:RNF149 [Symbiodinium microadriaticum]
MAMNGISCAPPLNVHMAGSGRRLWMDPDAYDIFVFHPEVPWSASPEEYSEEESNSETYSDLDMSSSTVYTCCRAVCDSGEGCDGCEETCAVCLETFQDGDSVRVLRCRHTFHTECVDRWLAVNRLCPLCKQDVAPTWKERKDVTVSGPSQVERVTLVLDFSAMQIFETRDRPPAMQSTSAVGNVGRSTIPSSACPITTVQHRPSHMVQLDTQSVQSGRVRRVRQSVIAL